MYEQTHDQPTGYRLNHKSMSIQFGAMETPTLQPPMSPLSPPLPPGGGGPPPISSGVSAFNRTSGVLGMG